MLFSAFLNWLNNTFSNKKGTKFDFLKNFLFESYFFMLGKNGKNVRLIPLIIKNSTSKGSRCPYWYYYTIRGKKAKTVVLQP